MWTLLVTFLAVLAAYFYLYKPHQHWKILKVPYVKPWPIVGNMAKFVFRRESIYDLINEIYNKTQGRYLAFYFFNTPVLMIRDLNLIKQIGIKDFDHFVDHRSFIDKDIDPLFGKNLFSLTGQEWRDMRATLSPAFTSSKMKAMFVLISDCAKQFTEYFENIVKPNEPYEIELKDSFTRFANDVIATTAFGIQCNSLKDRDNEFYMMGKSVTNLGTGIRSLKVMAFTICKPLMILLRATVLTTEESDFFRNIIKSNIASREKEGIVRPDMIHLLMEARKGKLKHEEQKDEDAGFATVLESDVGKNARIARQELSDDDITAQALIFFFAGFETISSAMCHMLYELAQHKDIQEKLQEEIDETLQECKGKLTYDVVMKMKYLDMVITETLRKWPALVAVDRACTKPYTIQPELTGERQIKLKKGDIIWIPTYPIHRDPKYYPEPEKFDPERFSDENKGNIDPMSYLPFGIGPRNCIGSRLALMEAKVIFSQLLSKFNIVLTEKSQVPIQIKKGQFNNNAEKGFWVGLKKRTNV